MTLFNVMLDGEFFATEEDVLLQGTGTLPLVTSFGLVVQNNKTREIVTGKLFPLNMQEQLANGATIGKNCIKEFWQHQPNFGKEFTNSLLTDTSMKYSIIRILETIASFREKGKIRIIGNNLIADNSKLLALAAEYCGQLPRNLVPSYFEHFDLQGLKRSCRKYLDLDFRADFLDEIDEGSKPLGVEERDPHNPIFDCLQQLYELNGIEAVLKARLNKGV